MSSSSARPRTRATWWPGNRGSGKARPLLLLAHLDVVEAKRSDWSVDPFKLLEKDGYFYGRGTGDDKAQAAIWVESLLRMRREGYRPSRDLIVALTADEEGAGTTASTGSSRTGGT
jgi:acetylornithine deacetylase/succinyl-diaminopimelate desuccinylase-like protein